MYQPSGDNRLPNPPCGEGAPIGVRTEQFRIDSRCIAPLVLLSPTPISVSSGKSVSITWVPPENSSVSRISIQLDLGHHGGFPTVFVSRYSAAFADTASQVKLSMFSSTERDVDTEVKSCMENKDCPSGVCRQDLSCE